MNASTSKLLSILALIFGLLGIGFTIVFLFTNSGATPLIVAGIAGLFSVVLGLFGVTRERAKALSVTGIVFGALVVVFATGLFLFAMVFVGAI